MTATTISRDEQRALIDEAIRRRVWTVVGASTSPGKWGYRVYQALRSSGYTVYPINPRATDIDGEPCYARLAALPQRPDVVNVVLPPKLGLHIVDEAAELGIPIIWFQPGSESAENAARARQLGLKTIVQACAIVERKARW